MRGLAVLAMVFFHFMWDLWYFGLTTQDIGSAPWQRFARVIGGTFIFVMGLSVALRASRPGATRWLVRRGLRLLGLGLLVSLATAAFAGEAWVRFGILHHAGAAMLLAIPFARARWELNAAIGGGVFALGLWLNTQTASFPWLLPFGVPQAGVAMLDYYPLLPWFGVMLAGLAAGQVNYTATGPRLRLPDLSDARFARGLGWLGRHSLAVYVIHQPVSIGLLLAARDAGVV